MTRRIDAGPLLAIAGALLLLVSLFLEWYEPSLEAWDVFEITDLLLVVVAIGAILAATSLIADVPGRVEGRWLPVLAAIALVLVAGTLLDRPPVIGDGDPGTGIWLALAGAALMAAGALLGVASVSVTFDVAARERRQRVPAVDARPAEAPVVQEPATEPLPPTEPKPPE